MSDPRVPPLAASYIQIFNDLGKLGKQGFAHMLDSASGEDLTELSDVAEVLKRHIERAMGDLGLR